MTIPFKQIPANLRVPLFYAEVDGSRANTAQAVQRALVIGQMTTAGTATPNVPVISSGAAHAAAIGGFRSMLAAMVSAYRDNDPIGELWCLPLADHADGVAATGSIEITAAATANGVLSLYVAGVRYPLAVVATQTAAQLATSLAALVNADISAPVTAAASGAVVTFTAANKGPVGNDIDIRVGYGGTAAGEATPVGLAYTITAMSGGATAPSLTAGLANLGAQSFDFIVCPYTDSTSLNALRDLLNDATGRWSYQSQIYGHVFAAKRGTLGELTTFGAARNDQHASVMGYADSPTPSCKWAAAVAGAAAVSLRNDPGMPLQTLVLRGVLAPTVPNRFVLTDRNTLLYTGVSTFAVGDDGTVAIENLITTYRVNAYGAADNSFLQVETLFTLAYVLRFMSAAITTKFGRVKLASDNTRFTAGSGVVTPASIRAELVAQYRVLEANGIVQNGDAFKDGLIVQQNATNPNRVDVLWPGTLIDQLRIFAVLAQFRLI